MRRLKEIWYSEIEVWEREAWDGSDKVSIDLADILAAFDGIYRELLITKLHTYWLSGLKLVYYGSLRYCKQMTKLGSVYIFPLRGIFSGVPQRSLLALFCFKLCYVICFWYLIKLALLTMQRAVPLLRFSIILKKLYRIKMK